MIGYDKNKYNEMMHNNVGGNFDKVCKNIKRCKSMSKKVVVIV